MTQIENTQGERNNAAILRFVKLVRDTHVQGFVSGYYCHAIEQRLACITPEEWYGRLADAVEASNSDETRRSDVAQSMCAQVMRNLLAEALAK